MLPVDDRRDGSLFEQPPDVVNVSPSSLRGIENTPLPAEEPRDDCEDRVHRERVEVRRQVDAARLQQRPASTERTLADRVVGRIVDRPLLRKSVVVQSITRSAPRCFTRSTFLVSQTLVPPAPSFFRSWIAAEPIAPVAS